MNEQPPDDREFIGILAALEEFRRRYGADDDRKGEGGETDYMHEDWSNDSEE